MRTNESDQGGGDRGRRRHDRHGRVGCRRASGRRPQPVVGKSTSASSVNGPYVTGNLNDGNQGSYWESSGALPQWAQIDLGAATEHRPGRAEAAGRLGHPHPDPVRAGQHQRLQLQRPSSRRQGYSFNPAANNR